MAKKTQKSGKRATRRDSLERESRPLKVKGRNPVARDALGRVSGGNPGNSGGKKGRSGRHTKAFKRFMQNLAMSAGARRSLKRIMAKGDVHPFFPFAMKLAAEYAHGKPQQHVDVTSKGRALEDIVGAANATGFEED